MSEGPNIEYALIFRTHFWDFFAQRQLERVVSRARSADIYVLVDETHGKTSVAGAANVFRLTDAEIINAGFVSSGQGSIQWYSGDVPLYLFFSANPHYDFYVQLEYDVGIHTDIDNLVSRLNVDGVDVLALKHSVPLEHWYWVKTCSSVYPIEEIEHYLLCFSVFSRRALSILFESRLNQAMLFKEKRLTEWPYCEAFVPTEAKRRGLKLADLSWYGNTSEYIWWPPHLEADLSRLASNTFVHPVLDPSRYVPSLFKMPEGIWWMLWPNSWLHRKLRRLGVVGYIRALLGRDFRRVLANSLARRLRKVRVS